LDRSVFAAYIKTATNPVDMNMQKATPIANPKGTPVPSTHSFIEDWYSMGQTFAEVYVSTT